MEPGYTYNAKIVRWVDGDTVDLRVDCGFYMRLEDRFRLYGIDTPERGQSGYKEATARARELAPVDTVVIIKTYKPERDKYGRWLADVYVGETNINQMLVAEGLAKEYFGGTKT